MPLNFNLMLNTLSQQKRVTLKWIECDTADKDVDTSEETNGKEPKKAMIASLFEVTGADSSHSSLIPRTQKWWP